MTAFASWQSTGAKTKHSVAKKTECQHGHKHDSRRESKRCNELHALEKAGVIAGLKTQPFYPFHVNGSIPKLANGHKVGVTLDFSYVDLHTGKMVGEDVKGRSKLSDSRDWPLRKALFKHIYRDVELREVRS